MIWGAAMPRRKHKKLHLKIRVKLTESMTKADAKVLIWRSVRTRIVQKGIELSWIDWSRAQAHGPMKGGEYIGKAAHDALVDFYWAIMAPGSKTRISVVKRG